MNTTQLLLGAVSFGIGLALGYVIRRAQSLRDASSAEQKIATRLASVETEAKALLAEAKEKAAGILLGVQKDERERKNKVTALEERLLQREESLDKRVGAMDAEEKRLRGREEEFRTRETKVQSAEDEMAKRLESVAKLTREEAKAELFRQMERQQEQELAARVQKFEKEQRDEMEKRAGEIITIALQR